MGAEMTHRRSWDEGLANKAREMRVPELDYRTIGKKLGIVTSKVRRILKRRGCCGPVPVMG